MAGKAILVMSSEQFLDLFRKNRHVEAYTIVQEGVPLDATLLGVSLDHTATPPRLEFVIEAPSLPQPRAGNLLPRITPVLATQRPVVLSS
jgi:hypothetical protein